MSAAVVQGRTAWTPATLCAVGASAAAGSLVALANALHLAAGSAVGSTVSQAGWVALGLGAGSLVGGWCAEKSARPLQFYGLSQAAAGASSLVLVALPAAAHLPAAPLLVPSFLAGLGGPALVRPLAAGRLRAHHRQPGLGLLGLAALGAAFGILGTTQALEPVLGVSASAVGWTSLQLTVGIVAWILGRRRSEEESADMPSPAPLESAGASALAIAVVGGFLTTGLGMISSHTFGLAAGGTSGTVSLAVASVLLGVAAGAGGALAIQGRTRGQGAAAASALVLASYATLAARQVWSGVPDLFLVLTGSGPRGVAVSSLRMLVAGVLVSLPAAMAGVALALLVARAGSIRGRPDRSFGNALAAVALGAVVAFAALGRGLPALGGLDSLRLLGVAFAVAGTGVAVLLASGRWRWALGGAALAGAALGVAMPVARPQGAFDPGVAVLLRRSTFAGADALFVREEPLGGLVSVVRARGVTALFSRGALVGDDADESATQSRLATLPVLLGATGRRAFVSGAGTGAVVAAVVAQGYERVIWAEPSVAIADAAREHFSVATRGVLAHPAVRVVPEDVRAALRGSEERFDLVVLGAPALWPAGAGSSHSADVYRLAAGRMTDRGLLVHWFPLHHLSALNLFLVANTARSVFPHVSVWTHRHLAAVAAGREPLGVDLDAVRDAGRREPLRTLLAAFVSGSPLELLGDLAIADRDADVFLDSLGELVVAKRGLVSRDARLLVEPEAARHVLDSFLQLQNRETLRRLRSRTHIPLRGEPTEAERALAEAAFLRGWRNPGALSAIAHLWGRAPARSQVASLWSIEELAGDGGVESTAALPEPAGPLAGMLSAGFRAAECEAVPPFVTDPRSPRRRVVASFGRTLPPSQPQAAVDDRSSPEWGQGWIVQPDERPPRLEVAFDRPRRIESVHIVVRPLDGAWVGLRLLGRDPDGLWRPLADAAGRDACGGALAFRTRSAVPLAGLLVEVRGRSTTDRLALHEVWAIESP